MYIAFGSLIIGIIVFILKYIAYYLTGSAAFYSDALESIINIIGALIALIAIHFSAKPADDSHHYGHYKAEYFSAVLEGFFIFLAAFAILQEAYHSYIYVKHIEHPFYGLVINGLSSIINGVWATILLSYGKKFRSPAIIADAKHIINDVLSSVGVVIGIFLATITGYLWLDPLLACLIAVNIIWSGFHLIKDSIGGLMDAAPKPEEVNKIREVITQNWQNALRIHNLRIRHAGRVIFIDFHLIVPAQMTVAESHAICDNIEEVLEAQYGPSVVTIHVEPDI